MNVGSYVQEREQNPYLDAKAVGRNGATGKVLAVNAVKTPNFNGLFLTVKMNGKKYAFPASFDRFDIGAIVAQTGSPETDDWIGESVKFVVKKSKDGKKSFVNAFNPPAKKGKKKGKR